MVASMKMTVSRDLAPYTLVQNWPTFQRCDDRPDDGGSKHLWNVGQFLRDYTAQHPRNQYSRYHSRDNPNAKPEWWPLYQTIGPENVSGSVPSRLNRFSRPLPGYDLGILQDCFFAHPPWFVGILWCLIRFFCKLNRCYNSKQQTRGTSKTDFA
jgi:hypothetical protein